MIDYSCVVFARDMTVSPVMSVQKPHFSPSRRGSVSSFSSASRRRFLLFCRNIDQSCLNAMITLTYPSSFPTDFAIFKKHLNRFLFFCTRARVFRNYIWFMEFQKRGAVHFHIFVDLSCSRTSSRVRSGKRVFYNRKTQLWLSRLWFTIVASGDDRHLRAGVSSEFLLSSDGAMRYATSYASKQSQKSCPTPCGRWWGHSRTLTLLSIKVILSYEQIVNLIHPGRRTDYVVSAWDESGNNLSYPRHYVMFDFALPPPTGWRVVASQFSPF